MTPSRPSSASSSSDGTLAAPTAATASGFRDSSTTSYSARTPSAPPVELPPVTLPDRYRPFLEKYPSLALIGGTRLFRVRVPELPENGAEIFAKAEWTNPGGPVKDRPVLRMLLEAVLSGEFTRERTILDSSSGNAGIAYAMIGSIRLDDGLPGR